MNNIKFLPVFVFYLWVIPKVYSQNCLPQGIEITTQSQIDSFPINYSSCTKILGGLTISGSGITNLNGLINLTEINGLVLIQYNHRLKNLIGLNNLHTIDSTFYIYDNDSLVTLDGLENLKSINGNLSIGSNHQLTSLSGLNNLTSIGGWLWIDYNWVLPDLTGLGNISPNTISEVILKNNLTLSKCAIKSICSYLNLPSHFNVIRLNNQGCNDEIEVKKACNSQAINDVSYDNLYSIYYFSTRNEIIIKENNYAKNTEFSIFNILGKKIIFRQIKETLTSIDITDLPIGVYILSISNQKIIETHKFIKN